jgi:hypothetical protein
MNYVIILDENIQIEQLKGRSFDRRIANRAYPIKEIVDYVSGENINAQIL